MMVESECNCEPGIYAPCPVHGGRLPTKPADILNDKVECRLVWKKAPDAETGGRPYLVAVDMTEERAKSHKKAVEYEGGMAMIEQSWVNHAYGESMTAAYGPFRSMMAEMRNKAKGG